jgi:hypothetical protein
MTTSLYDLTIPVFLKAFGNMRAFLEKGRAHSVEQGLDPDSLLQLRLIGDMHPLVAQIQRCSDSAKGCAVRLGGMENVSFPDEETTFDQLLARIDKTVDFLKSVPREAIDGKEEAEVVLKLPNTELKFTGISYVLDFALPNFFFHETVAYALLRANGAPIGKVDFLSGGTRQPA